MSGGAGRYLIDDPTTAFFINTFDCQVLCGLLPPPLVDHRVFPSTNLLAQGVVFHMIVSSRGGSP